MKRACLLFACIASVTPARLARAGVEVGPEFDVGTLQRAPSNPPLTLTRDGSGIVAAFWEARVPFAPETQLFVQRLDDSGQPSSAALLVSTNVNTNAILLEPTSEGALLLWTDAKVGNGLLLSPSTPSTGVESALVQADGSLGGIATITGLAVFPTSLYCNAGRCAAASGSGLQEFTLADRVASPPFDVAATSASSPGVPTLAGIDTGYVAARQNAAPGGGLLSASLGFGRKVRRPFELFSIVEDALPALRLIPGADGYLLGFDHYNTSAALDGLRVAVLDQDGRPPTSALALPSSGSPGTTNVGSWSSVWAAGRYRVLMGGNPQHYAVVTPDGQLESERELLLAAQANVGISKVVSAGDQLLASFNANTSSLPAPDVPNLALLGLDGGVRAVAAANTRPSQQSAAHVAANRGRLLVAYEDRQSGLAPSIHYAVLDDAGRELGVEGQVNGAVNATASRAIGWTVAPTDDGFLIHAGKQVSFVDPSRSDTHADVALPLAGSSAWGGDVLLVLTEYSGGCGEDCVWGDIGAQRFARDGTALDSTPLFEPPPHSSSVRSSPSAIWDGTEFVAVAIESRTEFRRIGADGTLIDPDWRDLDPILSDQPQSYALATHDGTTLVVWTTASGVRAARISSTLDDAPMTFDIATEGGAPGSISATHDGQRFLVAWEVAGGLHAATVEPDGSVHGRFMLPLPEDEPKPRAPALASLADGKALLAYHRFDERPAELTSRVKLRFVSDGASELGSTCAADADCISAFCAAGVCCSERCAGACQSCQAIDTGAADGTCGSVTSASGNATCETAAPAETCDDTHACPPRFTCEPLRKVCVPPETTAPSPATKSTGCAYRAIAAPSSEWGVGVIGLGLCLRLLRRPGRKERHPAADQVSLDAK